MAAGRGDHITPSQFLSDLRATRFECAFNPFADRCAVHDRAKAPETRAENPSRPTRRSGAPWDPLALARARFRLARREADGPRLHRRCAFFRASRRLRAEGRAAYPRAADGRTHGGRRLGGAARQRGKLLPVERLSAASAQRRTRPSPTAPITPPSAPRARRFCARSSNCCARSKSSRSAATPKAPPRASRQGSSASLCAIRASAARRIFARKLRRCAGTRAASPQFRPI